MEANLKQMIQVVPSLKHFRLTGSGKLVAKDAGKGHGLRSDDHQDEGQPYAIQTDRLKICAWNVIGWTFENSNICKTVLFNFCLMCCLKCFAFQYIIKIIVLNLNCKLKVGEFLLTAWENRKMTMFI